MGRRNRFTDSPTFIKIISVFLAIILWFFVAGNRQDALGFEMRLTFSGIPVNWRNLGEDLAVVEMTETVTLSLQGMEQAFDGLTPADLEAYVDLRGKREGRHEMRIHASAPPGLTIVRIEPAKTTVVLEEVITRHRGVEGVFQGRPGGGMVIAETDFKPKEVFIRGPRRKVEVVEKVIFNVDLEGLTRNIREEAFLFPVDARGSHIQGVTVSPDKVEVAITLTYPEKDVSVYVVFANDQGRLESYSVEPSVVTIKGPRYLLEDISQVITQEVDLSTLEGEFQVEVPLIFPEGVEPVNVEVVKLRGFLTD